MKEFRKTREGGAELSCRGVRDKGSLTLFAAAITAASIFFIYLGNILAAYHLFQVRMYTAMQDQGEQILASYERKLLDRYGLFAFSGGKVNRRVFESCLEEEGKKYGAQWEAEPAAKLEGAELKKQILFFMRARLPVGAAGQLWQRLRFLFSKEQAPPLRALPSSDFSPEKALTGDGPRPLPAPKTRIPGYAEVKVRLASRRSEKLPEHSRGGRNAGAAEMKVVCDTDLAYIPADARQEALEILKYLRKSEDFYKRKQEIEARRRSEEAVAAEETEEEETPNKSEEGERRRKVADFFSGLDQLEKIRQEENRLRAELLGGGADPAAAREEVSAILDQASTLFSRIQGSSIPLYDSFCLNEYILGNFSSEVRHRGKNLNSKADNYGTTWRGKDFAKQSYGSNHEVEEIITGRHEKTADFLCKTYTYLLRLLVQALTVREDRGAMLKIQALARLLSIGSWLVGRPIPYESCEATLVFLEASRRAYCDLRALTGGNSVPLIPGKKFTVDYVDYLRLYLLFSSDEEKLARVSAHLSGNIPGNFFVSLKIGARWHFLKTREASREVSYDIKIGGTEG